MGLLNRGTRVGFGPTVRVSLDFHRRMSFRLMPGPFLRLCYLSSGQSLQARAEWAGLGRGGASGLSCSYTRCLRSVN